MKKISSFLLLVISISFHAMVRAQTNGAVKNVVIVHGAFADGSGWEQVYKLLTAKGYHVSVVQNPLSSLEDDVEATVKVLDRQDGPTVLVGHSWGGTVITQAGMHPRVTKLVYVAAFAPQAGEKTIDLIMTAAPAPENGILPPDDKGMVWYDAGKFHAGFCADVDKAKAGFMYASQGPIAGKCFLTPLTQTAWTAKPSWAIVATEDKSINPEIERTMYKRAGSQITELKGSHAIYVSQAAAVAGVIEKAAKG